MHIEWQWVSLSWTLAILSGWKYKLVDRGSILATRRKLFWMGRQAVWSLDQRCTALAIFRPFRPPFAFSDPDLRAPISLPLPCRSSRAAATGEREWSKPISVWRKTPLVIVWLFSVAIWFQCKSIPIEQKYWHKFPSCVHWQWQTVIEMTAIEMTMILVT